MILLEQALYWKDCLFVFFYFITSLNKSINLQWIKYICSSHQEQRYHRHQLVVVVVRFSKRQKKYPIKKRNVKKRQLLTERD